MATRLHWTTPAGGALEETPAQPRGKAGIGRIYRESLRDARRQRLFVASVGFFCAFGIARGMAHAAANNIGPFHFVESGGNHIHHLVWGILMLLLVGYVWVMQIGTGVKDSSRGWSLVTAALFGIGSALTLDEFALWVKFTDQAYFGAPGRANIEAVLFFGGLLSIGIWGSPFFKALITAPFHRP